MKKAILTLLFLVMTMIGGIAQNHWVPDPYQFATNMNVIGVVEINGFEQRNEFLELGVFCDEECRGSMLLDYVPQLDRYYLYLTVYGSPNDFLTFALYDHFTGTELELECENFMDYQSNAMLGSISEPYVFVFNGGACEVHVVADPPEGGTVTGGGMVAMGSLCTVTAVPLEGVSFLGWQMNGDFLTFESSYTFNAVANIDFIALFGDPFFQVTVDASPVDGGTVTGGGEYLIGETCVVTATPNPGYTFDFWKAGDEVVSNDASYSFVIHNDCNLTAFFHLNTYTVTLSADPAEGGEVTGGGVYVEGELCTVSATTHNGFTFLCWMENGVLVSGSPSFSFAVTGDRWLVANYAVNPNNYLISVSANPSEGGMVTGGGAYQEGSVCSLTAVPAADFAFDRWTENGVLVTTLPTYTFVVSGDRHLVAHFHNIVGVQEETASLRLYPNPTHQWLWAQGAADSPKTPFVIADLQGRVVLISADNPMDVSHLSPGIYVINGQAIENQVFIKK